VKPPAQALADTLAREAELYEQLLSLLRREEAALLSGTGRVTAETLGPKDALLAEIQAAERSRREAVGRLTGRPDTRLRDLPEAHRGELARARARLSTLLPEVAESARRVDVLLARGLRRLQHTLEIVRDALGLGPEYTPGGALLHARLPTLDGRA